jgi:polyhydroxybutyrate depolymerase
VTSPRGAWTFSLRHDGRRRTFKVHVPAGYTGTEPVPLVFGIHGLAQGAIMFGVRGSDLEAKSDEEGFIAVFPNGTGNSWDAGSCCGSGDSDDVGFFRALIAHVRDGLGLCVDRTRVYATGLSNGGFMSYRLGCEASDVFAAVAPVAGSLMIDAAECEAARTRPVPLLHLHGNDDSIVAYDGSSGFSAVQSVADWASMNGCSATSVPASQPISRLDTSCVTYPNCDEGAEVTLCTVEGGGHCWFGNETCGTGAAIGAAVVGNNAEGIVAADAVWGFFSRFRCETCGL